MQNFSIFKNNNKKNEKEPDYKMSGKVGDGFVEIGACWKKTGSSGDYLSCQLSKPYKDRKGFVVVEEDILEAPPEL